jgi:FkbM family methyltransferase
MNAHRVRQWLRAGIRRFGFDVVRHPTPRDLEGHVKLLLDELTIDHVLDVGANTGQYGQFLRRSGYTGKITSFEPVSSTFAALQATIAGDSEWNAVKVALGAEPGAATIHVMRSRDYSSMLPPNTEQRGPACDMEHDEQVRVVRLDDVYADLVEDGSSVLLKLDTQGWDLVVLVGAARCLSDVSAIQTEVSIIPLYDGMPTWIDSMARVAELGFAPTGLFPVTYADNFRSVEFDLIAARTQRAAGLSLRAADQAVGA